MYLARVSLLVNMPLGSLFFLLESLLAADSLGILGLSLSLGDSSSVGVALLLESSMIILYPSLSFSLQLLAFLLSPLLTVL
jgi:hypothetical protein